jgi:hypothetical protein
MHREIPMRWTRHQEEQEQELRKQKISAPEEIGMNNV